MNGYTDSLEHLRDELERIELMLRLHTFKFRVTNEAAVNELRGLYIKEEEIDRILSLDQGLKERPESHGDGTERLARNLLLQEKRISERMAQTPGKEAFLRLERLRNLYDLQSLDMDIVLICLLPEVELHYEKLYAYLQDDVTRKRPTVNLVLDVLCGSFQESLEGRERF